MRFLRHFAVRFALATAGSMQFARRLAVASISCVQMGRRKPFGRGAVW
jgi:hypothetical protein